MTNEEFDDYLESIGGLISVNSWAPSWDPHCKLIKSHGFFDTAPGWNKLIKDCIDECIAAGWGKRIYQVKQKFGELRFYAECETSELYDIVDKYEALSRNVCEECGKDGNLRVSDRGWWYTSCDEHSRGGELA